MPFRLAAPEAPATRSRNILTAVVIVAAFVAAERYVSQGHRSQAGATAPATPSAVPVAAIEPPVPTIVASDGSAVPPERLRGRWTMLYAPGEPCVETCARVLETLSAVARDPASGVQEGVAQIVLTRPRGKDPAAEIVVLDPEGRSAGLISHVTDAGRVVSGLATLRAAYVAGNSTASR